MILEPGNHENPQTYDLFEWLKRHEGSLGGSIAYEQMIEIYELGRVGIERLDSDNDQDQEMDH